MKLFVLRDGHQTGPFTPQQAQDLLLREYFKPSDLAWHEELVSWQPLSYVLPDLLAPSFPIQRGGDSRPQSQTGEWLPPLRFNDADLNLAPPPPPSRSYGPSGTDMPDIVTSAGIAEPGPHHHGGGSAGTRSRSTADLGGKTRKAGESGSGGIIDEGPLNIPPAAATISLRMAIVCAAFHPLLFLAGGLALPVPPIHAGVLLLGVCTVGLLIMNTAGLILGALSVYSERTRSAAGWIAIALHIIQLAGMTFLLGLGMFAVYNLKQA